MLSHHYGLPTLGKTGLRQVNRAASELRRGVPVIISGTTPLLLLAAETAGTDTLSEIELISGTHPTLILASSRATAILRTPVLSETSAVAVLVPPSIRSVELYQSLADPTSPQSSLCSVRLVPTPSCATAAIALAKISRLLPALLAVPLAGIHALRKARQGLVEVSEAHILAYQASDVSRLNQVASAMVPIAAASDARVFAFRSDGSAADHLAIVLGHPELHDAPLVRLHSECFTGDLLASLRCDCGDQLRGALSHIADAGAGVLLYLGQEGRGIGLFNKLRAYELQDRGLDTMDANRALGWGIDERNFLIGATMLRDLGINRIRLLTNNPNKVKAMQDCGIIVVERMSHVFMPNGTNDDYLATKAARLGHLLD